METGGDIAGGDLTGDFLKYDKASFNGDGFSTGGTSCLGETLDVTWVTSVCIGDPLVDTCSILAVPSE